MDSKCELANRKCWALRRHGWKRQRCRLLRQMLPQRGLSVRLSEIPLPVGDRLLSNTMLLDATQVFLPNVVCFRPAALAERASVQTDGQTTHGNICRNSRRCWCFQRGRLRRKACVYGSTSLQCNNRQRRKVSWTSCKQYRKFVYRFRNQWTSSLRCLKESKSQYTSPHSYTNGQNWHLFIGFFLCSRSFPFSFSFYFVYC